MIIDSILRLRMLLMLRMTSSEFPVAQYVVVDAKDIRLKFEDSNLKHVYFELEKISATIFKIKKLTQGMIIF